jgi:hypothetical protein
LEKRKKRLTALKLQLRRGKKTLGGGTAAGGAAAGGVVTSSIVSNTAGNNNINSNGGSFPVPLPGVAAASNAAGWLLEGEDGEVGEVDLDIIAETDAIRCHADQLKRCVIGCPDQASSARFDSYLFMYNGLCMPGMKRLLPKKGNYWKAKNRHISGYKNDWCSTILYVFYYSCASSGTEKVSV